MYGPSFFTGSLIARFGAQRIVATGLLLEAVAATIGLSGITAMHFWATLIVLGVGWNFGFVGASALVLETHRPQERNKVQAFNDFLVFGMMAVGSFSSGQLLANFGWSAVNLVVYPPVLFGLAVLMLASFARRRAKLQTSANFPIRASDRIIRVRSGALYVVVAGLVPAIHVFGVRALLYQPRRGASGMTRPRLLRLRSQ